jgi:hypothetical protein
MLELSVKRQLVRRGILDAHLSRLSRHEVAMLFLIDFILRGCSATIGIPRRPHC